MATAKQRAWRAKFASLYGHRKHLKPRSHHRVRTHRTRSVSMSRRRYGRRHRSSGGFGMGRLLSVKNILFTVGGAMLAPRVLNMDGKLGAAAGGFIGAGLPGAIVGYVAAPFLSGITGSGNSSGTGAW